MSGNKEVPHGLKEYPDRSTLRKASCFNHVPCKSALGYFQEHDIEEHALFSPPRRPFQALTPNFRTVFRGWVPGLIQGPRAPYTPQGPPLQMLAGGHNEAQAPSPPSAGDTCLVC